jgi:hypothetical protein
MGWEVPPHPSYSLDLVPTIYYLFGFVKDQLCGRFETREAIQNAVHQCLQMAETEFSNLRTLEEMCAKKWRLCGKMKKGL